MGGVLDDSPGYGIWNGWLAGSGPDTSGEERRCVRNADVPVVRNFSLLWSSELVFSE